MTRPRYAAYVGEGPARVLGALQHAWRWMAIALLVVGALLVAAWAFGGRPGAWAATGVGAIAAGAVQLAFTMRQPPRGA